MMMMMMMVVVMVVVVWTMMMMVVAMMICAWWACEVSRLGRWAGRWALLSRQVGGQNLCWTEKWV